MAGCVASNADELRLPRSEGSGDRLLVGKRWRVTTPFVGHVSMVEATTCQSLFAVKREIVSAGGLIAEACPSEPVGLADASRGITTVMPLCRDGLC